MNWFRAEVQKLLSKPEKQKTKKELAEEAKNSIQKKCGLADKTMDYLSAYKSADDLFIKLWDAMK
jgi:ornithine carbamoyltransferase